MFKTCPYCRREFKVNTDGTIRRHWCETIVGDSKILTFATGGTLAVRLDANWMVFGDAERAVINTIIDAMHEYELHLQNKTSHTPDLCSGDVQAGPSTDATHDAHHMGRQTPGPMEVSTLPETVFGQERSDASSSTLDKDNSRG